MFWYLLVLNTRAVHLELLNSMDTEQFILAFVRFCNRYCLPKNVYADNAKSFQAGGSILKEIMESDIFQSKFSCYNIKFKFSPVYSPWYGATWERLIVP